MPKQVNIQIKDLDRTIVIESDDIVEMGEVGLNGFRLTLKKDGKEVGKFNGNAVVGWWITEIE
jgi:hypothetical protein